MNISASGVLLRAAERLEKTRDSKQTGYMLRQLYKHLTMLHEDQTEATLAKFFSVWVDFDQEAFKESQK